MSSDKKFRVSLIPVFLGSADPAAAGNCTDGLPGKALECVHKIYNSLNNRVLTGRDPTFAKQLNNGVLGICADGSFGIFRVRVVGAAGNKLTLSGFFIEPESVRTAWKVFRAQVISICVGGADMVKSKVTYGAEELYAKAAAALAGMDGEPGLRARADRLISKMAGAPVPYSFFDVDYPAELLKLPYKLEATAPPPESSPSADTGTDNGHIGFAEQSVNDLHTAVANSVPLADRMRLYANNRKFYMNLKKEEYRLTLSKPECKAKTKELDQHAELRLDLLWFFTRCDNTPNGTAQRVQLCGDDELRRLGSGALRFADLLLMMNNADMAINSGMSAGAGAAHFPAPEPGIPYAPAPGRADGAYSPPFPPVRQPPQSSQQEDREQNGKTGGGRLFGGLFGGKKK